jgi:CelD/BcsL family acetyltransferase involved in cellulose biosynthesis
MSRALADGKLDLLRVEGDDGDVGMLYNFRHAGVVYAYQSALTDPGGAAHARPGMTCHAAAIRLAAARGDRAYDFLAGDQRYKRSFADASVALSWVELARPLSLRAARAVLHALHRRFRPVTGPQR